MKINYTLLLMENTKKIKNHLSHLPFSLVDKIMEFSTTATIEKGTEIVREGQYIKVIPIVIDGLVRVFSRYEEKELLLYYIKPSESCVMSFSAGMNEIPSNVVAVTESESTILLIPIAKVKLWISEYKEFNSMFYSQYNSRYGELISAMNHVLFDKMDKRLFDYLEEKVKLTNKNPIKISHNQIANDLGTAREVISRVMKKLQEQNKVIQHSSSIEFLG